MTLAPFTRHLTPEQLERLQSRIQPEQLEAVGAALGETASADDTRMAFNILTDNRQAGLFRLTLTRQLTSAQRAALQNDPIYRDLYQRASESGGFGRSAENIAGGITLAVRERQSGISGFFGQLSYLWQAFQNQGGLFGGGLSALWNGLTDLVAVNITGERTEYQSALMREARALGTRDNAVLAAHEAFQRGLDPQRSLRVMESAGRGDLSAALTAALASSIRPAAPTGRPGGPVPEAPQLVRVPVPASPVHTLEFSRLVADASAAASLSIYNTSPSVRATDASGSPLISDRVHRERHQVTPREISAAITLATRRGGVDSELYQRIHAYVRQSVDADRTIPERARQSEIMNRLADLSSPGITPLHQEVASHLASTYPRAQWNQWLQNNPSVAQRMDSLIPQSTRFLTTAEFRQDLAQSGPVSTQLRQELVTHFQAQDRAASPEVIAQRANALLASMANPTSNDTLTRIPRPEAAFLQSYYASLSATPPSAERSALSAQAASPRTQQVRQFFTVAELQNTALSTALLSEQNTLQLTEAERTAIRQIMANPSALAANEPTTVRRFTVPELQRAGVDPAHLNAPREVVERVQRLTLAELELAISSFTPSNTSLVTALGGIQTLRDAAEQASQRMARGANPNEVMTSIGFPNPSQIAALQGTVLSVPPTVLAENATIPRFNQPPRDIAVIAGLTPASRSGGMPSIIPGAQAAPPPTATNPTPNPSANQNRRSELGEQARQVVAGLEGVSNAEEPAGNNTSPAATPAILSAEAKTPTSRTPVG